MALATVILALAAGHQPVIEHPPAHINCTYSCVQRVQRHERFLLRRRHRYDWAQYVKPYRSWLRSTRMCESGGNYRTATGNGFWGAYQFTLESWAAVGGHGLPSDAEPLEQDYRAVRLLHLQGRGAWPVCGH
jgi:Transglycosylase-like domain